MVLAVKEGELTGRPGLMKAYLAPVRRGRREENSVRTKALVVLVQPEYSKMLMLNGKGTLEFLLGDLFLVTYTVRGTVV